MDGDITQQDGRMRWQSPEDSEYTAAELDSPWGYGDVLISYKEPGPFDHSSIRLSALEMDDLARWWLIHRHWTVQPPQRGEE